jgi:hypothetical protein
MSKISVSNKTEGTLGLWLEPCDSDHWMRPGEEFTVITERESDESPFNVVVHDQGISVWVNTANDAEVFDRDGKVAPCGHQRPIEVLKGWLTDAEQALPRLQDGSTTLQDMARTHVEQLRHAVTVAEAAEQ